MASEFSTANPHPRGGVKFKNGSHPVPSIAWRANGSHIRLTNEDNLGGCWSTSIACRSYTAYDWAILPPVAEREMQKLATAVLFMAALGLKCLIPQSAALAEAKSCTSVDAPRCFINLKTGIRMAYVEVGPADGRPVILLHGLTDSARSWALSMVALHELNPSLHIIALDQRGHGQSSMPPGTDCPKVPKTCFTPKLFAEDLVDFMDQKKIDRASIAGHSMGSIVAQRWRSIIRSG
jgi:hypothetical protein